MSEDTDQKSKKKSFLGVLTNPQNIVAFSAVFISACALFVSFYEARIMRRWQQASLWPRVLVGESYATLGLDSRDYYISVFNSGVGPAIIKGVRVEVDGAAYAIWPKAFSALIGENEDLPFGFNGFSEVSGNVFPPNEGTRAFSLNERSYYERIMAERDRLDMTICYCDVFDTCWTSSLRNREAKPADSCPAEQFNFKQ